MSVSGRVCVFVNCLWSPPKIQKQEYLLPIPQRNHVRTQACNSEIIFSQITYVLWFYVFSLPLIRLNAPLSFLRLYSNVAFFCSIPRFTTQCMYSPHIRTYIHTHTHTHTRTHTHAACIPQLRVLTR